MGLAITIDADFSVGVVTALGLHNLSSFFLGQPLYMVA